MTVLQEIRSNDEDKAVHGLATQEIVPADDERWARAAAEVPEPPAEDSTLRYGLGAKHGLSRAWCWDEDSGAIYPLERRRSPERGRRPHMR